MEPKIVRREGFRVMGVAGHFGSAAEDFGPLWHEYMGCRAQIEPLGAGEGHYGVYLGADHAKPIDYLAGTAAQSAAIAPQGAEVREVPAALYAVFECLFQQIGPTYGCIWGQWFKSSAYEQAASKLGFDYFPPDSADGDSPMEIWIPVNRKEGS